MSPVFKRIAGALALAAALLLVGAGPASAAPCWKNLLTDWYDGSIDKTYPVPCYNQAVQHLPTDIANYSSARDDILRALQQVVAAKKRQTETTTSATTTSSSSVPPPTNTGPTDTGPAKTTPAVTTKTTPSPGRKQPKGIQGAIDKLTPGEADSFPLPLLILGGLAVLLVGAGVAGMLWRRSQGGPA